MLPVTFVWSSGCAAGHLYHIAPLEQLFTSVITLPRDHTTHFPAIVLSKLPFASPPETALHTILYTCSATSLLPTVAPVYLFTRIVYKHHGYTSPAASHRHPSQPT